MTIPSYASETKSDRRERPKRTSLRVRPAVLAWLAVALGAGCVATVRHEPEYVEVDDAPVAVETQPHRVYEGHDVYYVNDHWYYRRGPRWAYYREEPVPLHRQRAYVREAPVAPRRAPPSIERHERVEERRSVRSAPPATMVR